MPRFQSQRSYMVGSIPYHPISIYNIIYHDNDHSRFHYFYPFQKALEFFIYIYIYIIDTYIYIYIISYIYIHIIYI